MMCFKDMTFCSQSSECNNTNCSRNFTDELSKQAEKWWEKMKTKHGPPIAYSSFKNTDYCAGFTCKS